MHACVTRDPVQCPVRRHVVNLRLECERFNWVSTCWYGFICHDGFIKWKHFRVTGPLWGEFTSHPLQRPVTRIIDDFFDVRLSKWFSKQWRLRCFEAQWRLSWRNPSCTTVMRFIATLPRYLPNVRAIRKLQNQILHHDDFTRSYDRASNWTLNSHPGSCTPW